MILPDTQVGAAAAFSEYRRWTTSRWMPEREVLGSREFGNKMSARFERKHTNKGNVYFGVGLLVDCGAPLEEEVQGAVKGLKANSVQNDIFPLVDSLTREKDEKAFTTLHSSLTPEEPNRRRKCGMKLSVVATGDLCGRCQ